ncbi:alanine racemase 1 [Jeotgalicoccus coquinae]|uniref:Alanine racemase n=1 Tax=Jeotgalicoccus coquinae TaxID=709509 RepID=A0A6V7RP46_9STAP|nr:alanine racemase [Jeotgalicoccus coquinae]MBB6424072.1 alanine racemase [Jeotgalicoccus coquinae]GGE22728.1 alanine racemase 1 [Jeotgalicoccus coquinae]CAD2079898.1 Alanine racemase 1 [Jeotgalicoccus coquinae]
MSDKYYRNTVLDVNLEAIEKNCRAIQEINPEKILIAVVKANAYGLGAKAVSEYLAEAGVTFFAVATLDEAIDLRMHGIKQKILVLGTILPKHINKAIQHRIAVTAPNLVWVKEAKSEVTDAYDKEVWIHIKVNTGMNRYGTSDADEVNEMIKEINSFSRFIYEGIYSHFTSSDEDNEVTDEQFNLFKDIVSQAERPEYVHISNSGGALTLKEDFTTAIRTGIALYGYYPSRWTASATSVELVPSVKLSAEISAVHQLEAGDSVSYGRKYTASKREKVATLPIGYADGLLRQHNGYKVQLEGGTDCEIIGTICMDALIIRVPEHTDAGVNVTIIDDSQKSKQSMESYSEYTGTISYESLCAFGRRIPRRYAGKDVELVYNEVIN